MEVEPEILEDYYWNITDGEQLSGPDDSGPTVSSLVILVVYLLLRLTAAALFIMISRVLWVVSVEKRFGPPALLDLHHRLLHTSIVESVFSLVSALTELSWRVSNSWRLGSVMCAIVISLLNCLLTLRPLMYSVLLVALALQRDTGKLLYWVLLSLAGAVTLAVGIMSIISAELLDEAYCRITWFSFLYPLLSVYHIILLIATIALLIVFCVRGRKQLFSVSPPDVSPSEALVRSGPFVRAVVFVAKVSLLLYAVSMGIADVAVYLAPHLYAYFSFAVIIVAVFIGFSDLMSVTQAIVFCCKYPDFKSFLRAGFCSTGRQQVPSQTKVVEDAGETHL